jgi:hypothetical protein
MTTASVVTASTTTASVVTAQTTTAVRSSITARRPEPKF